MPKRKGAPCGSASQPRAPLSLASFDAALDMLADETFKRLEGIKCKFEASVGFDIDDGAVRMRWEDAVKRYWVMKSMDDLCCGAKPASSKGKERAHGQEDGRMDADEPNDGHAGPSGSGSGSVSRSGEQEVKEEVDEHGRVIAKPHPGAVVLHDLNAEEEHEWRKWIPRMGDVVLCDTPHDGIWPGKIIDKKSFFVGRTQPKGNHFFAIRIYNPDMEPTLSIKSRLLPLTIRPIAPLLSPAALLSAYNHATCPEVFDLEAHQREYAAADRRAHPGMADAAAIKASKAEWNGFVNWVMNERRAEKLRNLAEERERRLRMMASNECREFSGTGTASTNAANGATVSRGREEAKASTGNGSTQQAGGQGLYGFKPSVLGPSAFSSPARQSGRDTEMVEMTTRAMDDIELDGDDGPRQNGGGKRQRRLSVPLPPTDHGSALDRSNSNGNGPSRSSSSSGLGIFNVSSTSSLGSASGSSNTLAGAMSTPRRTSSPFRLRPGMSMASSSALATPTRPLSPRRLEKRRGSGIMGVGLSANGYDSPRRGSWTPPRILPSGDETAPFKRFSYGANGGGGGMTIDGEQGPGTGDIWNRQFDFVSPLGPVRAGIVDSSSMSFSDMSRSRTMSPLAMPNGQANGHAHLNGHGNAADPGGDSHMDDSGSHKHEDGRGADTPHTNHIQLGPEEAGMHASDSGIALIRRQPECLEVVKEEEEEGEWTLVSNKRSSWGSSMKGHPNGDGDIEASGSGRERGSSAPCPETPVGKGKSVMPVKDIRQRELMMTPTRNSSTSAAGRGGAGMLGGDMTPTPAQTMTAGGSGVGGVLRGGNDDDVEL